MTIQEQEHIKQKGYKEAMHYIANAKDYLQKAGIDEDDRYKSKKYVRTACGTAYLGVLEALNTYLRLKNPDVVKSKEPKTIDFYRRNLAKENRKVLSSLNTVYTFLHIDGYYQGVLEMMAIKIGFQRAQEIIDLIKPAGVAQ
ncbi:MAG: DUF5618 family protein [Fibromonadaceae bacterium]|jgi:hypothetical protein|nr:DUF5618 family protein [Fibromonadaceae bacterium]